MEVDVLDTNMIQSRETARYGELILIHPKLDEQMYVAWTVTSKKRRRMMISAFVIVVLESTATDSASNSSLRTLVIASVLTVIVSSTSMVNSKAWTHSIVVQGHV